jgi:hypothetical protein
VDKMPVGYVSLRVLLFLTFHRCSTLICEVCDKSDQPTSYVSLRVRTHNNNPHAINMYTLHFTLYTAMPTSFLYCR